MTLLGDLEAAEARIRLKPNGQFRDEPLAARLREHAKRLRSEMNVRADNPLMIHVLQFINGGPLK